jgi:hypothetical protein
MINIEVSKCLNIKAAGYFVAFTLIGYFLLIAYMHLILTPNPRLRLLIITSYFVGEYSVAKILTVIHSNLLTQHLILKVQYIL